MTSQGKIVNIFHQCADTGVGNTDSLKMEQSNSNGMQSSFNPVRQQQTGQVLQMNGCHSVTSNGSSDCHSDFYTSRPPPPMYRRVPPPPAAPPVTHMMTLDRRIPGSSSHLQHQLLPTGSCDVTLNRRHYTNNNGEQIVGQRRRLAEDLWLV